MLLVIPLIGYSDVSGFIPGGPGNLPQLPSLPGISENLPSLPGFPFRPPGGSSYGGQQKPQRPAYVPSHFQIILHRFNHLHTFLPIGFFRRSLNIIWKSTYITIFKRKFFITGGQFCERGFVSMSFLMQPAV